MELCIGNHLLNEKQENQFATHKDAYLRKDVKNYNIETV